MPARHVLSLQIESPERGSDLPPIPHRNQDAKWLPRKGKRASQAPIAGPILDNRKEDGSIAALARRHVQSARPALALFDGSHTFQVSTVRKPAERLPG